MSPMYYDLNHFDRDHYPILLLLPSGEEIVAFRKTVSAPGRARYVKWVMKVWNKAARKEEKIDLPRAAGQPTRWRPIEPARFPDPLPPPAHVMRPPNWRSPVAPPSIPEIPEPFEWPAEYSPPGRISRKEAEVRLIRGLRTERSKKSGTRQSAVGSIGLSDVARLEIRAKGRIEYEHKESLATQLAHVGELWEPTRKDHGDWSTAVSWFNKLGKEHRYVVFQRSLNPQTSYRQIGEAKQKSESWARKVYTQAVDRVEKIANRKT